VHEGVQSVAILPEESTLATGNSLQMQTSVLPESAINKQVLYSTDSPDKADVNSSSGLVTIKSDAPNSDIHIIATSSDNPSASDSALIHIVQSAKGVILNPRTASLLPNETAQLIPAFTPANAQNKSVTYQSNNASIASVNPDGLVTAHASGQASITVVTDDGHFTSSSLITVGKNVEDVLVSPNSATIKNGEHLQLTVDIQPEDAMDKQVTFSSDNENIATVDSSGLVTGIGTGSASAASGQATIRVVTHDGSYDAYSTITVTQRAAGLVLTPEMASVNKGQTTQLSAAVNPPNAFDKYVSFSSSNPSVASVSSTGLVTGLLGGYATISATSRDGGFTDTSQITVYVGVESVSLDIHEAVVKPNGFLQLNAQISPADAVNKNVIFSSSDDDIASVDEDGSVSVPDPDHYKAGTAIITVRTADGSFTDSCSVRVPKIVSSVELSPGNAVLRIGTPNNTVQMITQILPTDAEDQVVRYYSSDPNIASVTQTGFVTAGSAPGFATITVVTNDGALSDYEIVEVQQPVTGVEVFPNQIELGLNRSSRVIPNILPYFALDKSVTYYSADPAIASVDSRGLVKGISKGETDIFVKTNDGGFEASSHVTVVSSVTEVTLVEKAATLQLGQKLQMHANVLPADAPNKAVKYKTSNASVAVVSASGLVETVSPGVATITVTTLDGYYEDTATITAESTPYNSSSFFDILGSLF
jgi:uncharacterized protein YjdB